MGRKTNREEVGKLVQLVMGMSKNGIAKPSDVKRMMDAFDIRLCNYYVTKEQFVTYTDTEMRFEEKVSRAIAYARRRQHEWREKHKQEAEDAKCETESTKCQEQTELKFEYLDMTLRDLQNLGIKIEVHVNVPAE